MRYRALAVTFLLLGTSAVFAPRAGGGVIRGRVLMPSAAPSSRPAADSYAGRASALADPRAPVRGAPYDAVIYIESLPADLAARLPDLPDPPRLKQEGQAFTPRVLAIPAGATVEFPNADPIYHSVFSVSPTRRFDLGRYGKGKSKRVTFPKPGLVNVYCDIHSNMEAFILVVPNRAVAQADAAGRFSLPDLPAGRYALVAWHPDWSAIRREVVVGAPEVDLDLRFLP